MLEVTLRLAHQESAALAKLLARLDYEIVRNCVDHVDEARALLAVIQQLRAAVERTVPCVPPAGRWPLK